MTVPPASATCLWTLPTPFDALRCVVWEEGAGWNIMVLFGAEPLVRELLPNGYSMQVWVDLLWRELVPLTSTGKGDVCRWELGSSDPRS
jgi:hypothetical protein